MTARALVLPGNVRRWTPTRIVERNGRTDASRGVALTAAIERMSADDSIHLGPGTFELAAGITPTHPLRIQGCGERTKIKYAGDVFTLTNLFDCGLKDLVVEGRVVGNGVCNFELNNVRIDGTGRTNALLIQGGTVGGSNSAPAGIRLVNSFFHNATGDGVHVKNDTNLGLSIIGGGAMRNGGNGLHVEVDSDYAAPADHWWSDFAYTGPNVTGGYYMFNTESGVKVTSVHDFGFSGVHSERNSAWGFDLTDPIEMRMNGTFSEYNTSGGISANLNTATGNWNSLAVTGHISQYELKGIYATKAVGNPAMLNIVGCIIKNIKDSASARGIEIGLIQSDLDLLIANNLIRGHSSGNSRMGLRLNGAGSGASYLTTSKVRMSDNIIVGPFSYSAMVCNRLHGPAITGNTFAGVANGIDLYYAKPVVEGNDFTGCSTAAVLLETGGDAFLVRRNTGYVTENKGSAQIAADATYIEVAHSLARTPSAGDISLTPASSLGEAVSFWISNIGAFTFQINVGAVPGSIVTFNWLATV